MKKFLILNILLISFELVLWPFNGASIKNLGQLESSTVYSVIQDSIGAVWLNTNYGVYRFNGITLEQMHSPLPMHQFTRWGRYLVTPSSHSLCFFDTQTRDSKEILLSGHNLSTAPIENVNGELLVAISDSLFKVEGDSLSFLTSITSSGKITVIGTAPGGGTVCGTSSGKCLILENGTIKASVKFPSAPNFIFNDSNGRIWLGLKNGGVYCTDFLTATPIRTSEDSSGSTFTEVRTFAENAWGDIYFGSADGLFRINGDFSVSQCIVNGMKQQPVCSTLFDKDGNLWIGTYYYGVCFCPMELGGINALDIPAEMRLIKGVAKDRTGHLWVATDNFGLYKYESGNWLKIPGTDGIKYQFLCYNALSDELVTSDYMGPLILYSLSLNGVRCQKMTFSKDFDEGVNIVSADVEGNICYLATSEGLFQIDTKREQEITQRIDGPGGRLSDVKVAPDGVIWVSGTGIFRVKDGTFTPADKLWPAFTNQRIVSQLTIDSDGTLWAAMTGAGCYHFTGDSLTLYTMDNSGLASNYVSSVQTGENGEIVFGTRSGLSIFSTEAGYCKNIPYPSGKKSTTGGKVVKLSDGHPAFFSSDCIVLMDEPLKFEDPDPVLHIDCITVNDERRTVSKDDRLVRLRHYENDFTLDVCSFDYAGIDKITYTYRVQGLEDNWKEFDIGEPLTFMNMGPGRYKVEIRGNIPGRGVLSGTTLSLRVIPAWYSTLFARLMFILLSIIAVFYVFYSVRARINLSRRLESERLEYEKRTRFFVELSYRIRTPLNIMIGQMERFFKDYGSRTAGIESIEDIFSKARQMRGLISDFVDEQDTSSNEDTRFLNAATGAVERNLFKKITVKTLCDELNICKTGLTERLERVSGKTPRQFIEDIRLEHAVQMLRDNKMRVSEISDRLMFSSPKYFTKRFKLKYGTSPSNFVAAEKAKSL